MSMKENSTVQNEKLKIPSVADIKNDLSISSPSEIKITHSDESNLEVKASEFVDQLLNFNSADMEEQHAKKNSVEQMGADIQKRAAKQSEMLRQPLKNLSSKAEDGGDVANALINLKVKVEELDPSKFNFEPGWFSRTLGHIPGIGTPIKRYFSKFESSQTAISAITKSLENGRDQLLRDNLTLQEDQKQMRETSKRLEQAIKLGQLMDHKIQYKLDREITKEDTKHRFISEELLFPLRQRIIDLQQQLAVSQQGVIATEIIMRNNKELSRGVNRAINVTVTALETAVTVAMALANQKIVLDKVNSVSKTTSDLIAGTAAKLKTQGAEIHKQASSAQLDLNSLKSAFADLKIAMEDVSTFRLNALPQMANSILELDKISNEAEKTIAKLEEGNKTKPQIKLDIQ
jgi:uncharacterized protein YaaN involved in tellurite resistance